jgi:hypothetical protein
MEAMTDAYRTELAQWGVSVSVVEPAYVKTSIADKGFGEHRSAATLTSVLYPIALAGRGCRREPTVFHFTEQRSSCPIPNGKNHSSAPPLRMSPMKPSRMPSPLGFRARPNIN